jgi:metallo-beta-lactamase class B
MVYADSLNPISAPGYLYTDPKRNPNGGQLLDRSIAVVSALPCDILLAPHPELVDTFGRLGRRDRGEAEAFVDGGACKAYGRASRERLARRVAEENPN